MDLIPKVIDILINTSLFLLIVIAISVGMNTTSKSLRRDSVNFLMVITFLLVLSR